MKASTMTHALQGKVVLITGASAGIGRATAMTLAQQGAHIIALGRREEALKQLQKELPSGAVRILAGDLNDDAYLQQVEALAAHVDIFVNKGEIVSIVGSSGAGKSTILHILGSLDRANSGEIWINNQRIDTLKERELAKFRNQHIGFVFQFHHLLPEFTALENVCIPGWIAGTPKNDLEARALELLKILGLQDRATHKPSELSGGEQQRVAVARALINNPDIVFADEPTGNLDSKHAQELHELFLHLQKTMGQTFLIVTHNEALAKMSDRVVHMKDGYIA
jgi:lipoprotein-releasing system ATP-binding protein